MRARSFVGAVLAMMISGEASSYLLIYLSRHFSFEEIRSTRAIYAEQSDRIRTMLAGGKPRREIFDARLGWRYRPGYHAGDDVINSQGVRSHRTYSKRTPSGVVRIAVFGNSFVYCNEVGTRDSWPALLEEPDREFEVLNYGVGGYGTDQALLRYLQEGAEFAPDLVLIGMAPIDLGRIVNVYLRFMHNRNSVATKPRFGLSDEGELTLLENPVSQLAEWRNYLEEPELVRRFGTYDHWYRASVYENPLYDLSATVRVLTWLWIRLDDRYFRGNRLVRGDLFNEESDAFRLQLAILRRFVEEVRGNGAEAAVLILPDRQSVTRDSAGQKPAIDPLVAALRHARVEVMDATLAFRGEAIGPFDSWFMSGGHYSPDGNRRVAAWLVRELRARRASAR